MVGFTHGVKPVGENWGNGRFYPLKKWVKLMYPKLSFIMDLKSM